MISKARLFLDFFKIFRDSKGPLSQKEVFDKLIALGYRRTTIQYMFTPSVLQPLVIKERGKSEQMFAEPLIMRERIFSGAKTLFYINPKYLNVTYNEFKEKLNFID